MVADDHDVVRYGVRMLLASHPELEIVAEVADVAALRDAVQALQPRLLVLDLQLGEESSLPLIPALLETSPRTRIVVHTMHAAAEYERACRDAGASAVVLKEAATADLVDALLAAVRDTGVRPRPSPTGVPPHVPLTTRERQVLGLIARGHTNQEVAADLHCSLRTVETHRARIRDKLKLSNRAEMIAWARTHPI